MALKPGGHPRAHPALWPLLTLGAVLAAQVALLQVAVNRLSWGLYQSVFAPAVAVVALSLASWFVYRQLDRESID